MRIKINKQKAEASNYAGSGLHEFTQYLQEKFDLTENQSFYLAGSFLRYFGEMIEHHPAIFSSVQQKAEEIKKNIKQ